ncbi:MAG: S8 family peptidase, partial [Candidatus Baldrarchaeia archaeon]
DTPYHCNLILHRPLVKTDLAWDLGYYGENVKIAILDTGVDETHPDIKLSYSTNVSEEGDNRDLRGHGTHVAVISAGRGKTGGYGLGIAPNADLISIKVLPGRISTLIKGMEIAFKKGADVLNLSLGGPGKPWDPDGKALHKLYVKGVVSSVAAGNSGPKYGTIEAPASNPSTIAVAAVNRKIEVTEYSSRGPPIGGHVKPDIAAPGGDYETPIISGRSKYIIDRENVFYRDYYLKLFGTSMATPFVTGAIALVIQALKENGFNVKGEEWSATVKAIILSTAAKIKASIWEVGAGLLDIEKAVKKAEKTNTPLKYTHPETPPPIPPPTSYMTSTTLIPAVIIPLSKIMEKTDLPVLSQEAKNLITAVKRDAGKKALTLLSQLCPPTEIFDSLLTLRKLKEGEPTIVKEIDQTLNIVAKTYHTNLPNIEYEN